MSDCNALWAAASLTAGAFRRGFGARSRPIRAVSQLGGLLSRRPHTPCPHPGEPRKHGARNCREETLMSADFDLERFCLTLVREMPDAVIYADGEGVIRFWNAGAERIFGFTAAEALGQSLDIIIPESLRARHWAGFDETMRTGKSRYGAGDVLAVPALRKDGTRISIEFTVLPFHDASGRMLGIAAVLRDVTTRFEQMKELRRQIAARGGGD